MKYRSVALLLIIPLISCSFPDTNLPATSHVEEVTPEDNPVPTLYAVYVNAENSLLLKEGESGDAIFTVRNLSDKNIDTFTLEVESPEGFLDTKSVKKEVTLGIHEHATIAVPVAIPIGTSAKKYKVVLRAQSNSAPLMSSNASVFLEVTTDSVEQ